jgi:hypothetical protein
MPMAATDIRDVLLSDTLHAQEVVVACTLYGEARGEPLRGQVGVWNVIANRVATDLHGDDKPDWWGEGVQAVCLKEKQFSCWWEPGPNFNAVYSLAETLLLSPLVTHHPRIEQVRWIAKLALSGLFCDVTGGANHYCTTAVVEQTAWAKGRTPTVVIGAHSFFKL